MNLLPWLVVHGAAVWQVCLALFVLAGLAFAELRPRIAARRAARAARLRLGWPGSVSEARKDQRVTLSGRLEAAEAPCHRFEDGSEAAAVSGAGESARAGRLVLRVGDATVRLDGPIEILTGSREAWPGLPLESLPLSVRRRVQDAAAPPGRSLRSSDDAASMGSPGGLPLFGATPVLRSLAPGDEVRISGVLREEAADEAPSYRDPAKRWALGGELHAAFDGAPRVVGPAARVRVPPVIATGVLFLALFGGTGEIAMGRAESELRVYAWAPEGAKLGAVAVAAVTPFRRQEALSALAQALDARADPDPGALAARAILHELRGERRQAAEMWIAHGDPERGAALAAAVHDFALEARGWYAAGRFEHAADAWERGRAAASGDEDEGELRFGVGVNLLAQRLDRAARAARRLSVALRMHPVQNGQLRRWYANRADGMACLADALDARRGDAEAWKALHAERPAPLLPACAVLRVDLFEGDQRTEAIRALPPLAEGAFDVPREWLTLLAAEAAPYGSADVALPFESAAEVLAVPNGEAMYRAVPGVERRMAEALARGPSQVKIRAERCEETNRHRPWSPCDRVKPSWTPARVSSSAAMFALLSGDGAGARTLSDMALAAYRPFALGRFGYMEPAPDELAAVVALPGDARPAQEMITVASKAWTAHAPTDFLHGLADLVAERDAGPLLQALVRRPPPDADEKQAWSLVAEGDGVKLSRWLRRPFSQPGTFLRLGAPLLRTGRDDVARWIRWGYRVTPSFHPTEAVIHLGNLAAAAEALAPGDLPASFRARAARFREAILRRETAIPLAVLERL